MAGDNQTINYSHADIERYHKGLLPPAQMHAMERAALEDPFLADAMDGYLANADQSHQLDQLREQIAERTEAPVVSIKRGTVIRNFVRAAVLLIGLAGAAFLIYQLGFSGNQEHMADNPSPVPAGKPSTSETAKSVPGASAADSLPATVSGGLADTTISTQLPSPVTMDNALAEREVIYQGDSVIVPPAVAFEEKLSLDEVKENQSGKSFETSNNSLVKRKATAAPQRSDMAIIPGKSTDTMFYTKDFEKQSRDLKLFRGRVTDPSNNALPFANVTNTTDNVGTYTDAQGYFTLVSPDSVLKVQIKSLGYENRQAQLVTYIPNNQVVLNEDVRGIDAVVVGNRQLNNSRSRSTVMVLEEPEPADGWVNYDTYLVNNIKSPEQLRSNRAIHGEVELSVEINDEGEPVNVTVTKSLCESCDREAIRLVMTGPRWKKKGARGKTTVKVPF